MGAKEAREGEDNEKHDDTFAKRPSALLAELKIRQISVPQKFAKFLPTSWTAGEWGF